MPKGNIKICGLYVFLLVNFAVIKLYVCVLNKAIAYCGECML